MKYPQEFEALGVYTLLDLALYLPQNFEDNILTSKPQNTPNAVVNFTPKTKKRNNSMLHVDGWCETWNCALRCVVFNAKPYHSAIFAIDEPIFVAGKSEFGYGRWNITQPRVIKKIGQVIPKYKSVLKNSQMIELIKKYVSFEKLLTCGLSSEEAKELLSLHVRPVSQEVYEKKVLPLLKKAEILNYLQKLSVKKIVHPSNLKLNSDISEFIKSLPFTLTGDQLKAIEDIKVDFVGEHAAKRVIMGDVGCGKTMVILCAIMLAYPHRVVLMAPTTVLATQLYEEAMKFLPPHVKVGLCISGAKKLELNSLHVVIGTSALLYTDIKDVALVLIDEQHRFGTAQRNLLKEFGVNPHFLQFSATPIPRTLGMINSKLVDYSFIKEIPFKKNIKTEVVHKDDFARLLEKIKDEIAKGHQVAVIYPKVEQSESNEYLSLQEARGFWEKRFERVFVTHGKDKDKEEILERFKDKGDILLATTVIEVGISLPRLTVMLVVGAERLGLATLHQLRGRVSRNGLDGFCYLFTYKQDVQRLGEFSKTLDGFKIADLDLKYRQSGDLLSGSLQHGVAFRWFSLSEDEEILKSVEGSVKPPVLLI